MKTIFVIMTAVSLFSFVLLQSANMQSVNAQSTTAPPTVAQNTTSTGGNMTKFKITSTSIFIGKDNEIMQIQNSSKVVQTLDEALQLTNGGLTTGKGVSKSLIITPNSTQLVDGDTAQSILEKELRSLSEKTPAPELVSEHAIWVYLGNGDSYHLDIIIV
jgi:hypothetical protein